MTYIPFIDYTPTPRFDQPPTPWTQIRINEGPGPNGPWTNIDQFAINPLDADPKHPITRSFSTDNAVLANGWYKVDFLDAVGNVLETNPVHNVLDVAWRPTLGDLGKIMMGRTADDVGVLQGTFTDKTQPTDEQAQGMITKAVRDLAPDIGTVIPDDLVQDAQDVTALRAAMFTELAYFGSEVATERSPYRQYKDLFEEQKRKLQNSISAEEAGASGVDEVSGGNPAFGFPQPSGWLTREM